MDKAIELAIDALNQGQVIAYPTEAIYGLGCDPWNPDAVEKLLNMKRRPIDKGFILVTDDFDKVKDIIEPVPAIQLQQALDTWPGHVTWLFPARHDTPLCLRGSHTSIAIRVSAHPIVRQLCHLFGKAIVSTSANRHDQPPATSKDDIERIFPHETGYIIDASVGNHDAPSQIRDVLTGDIIRR